MFVYVVGIVVVGGIVASFFLTRSEVNDVGSRVTKVESPCLRYGPKSHQCKEAFEAAVATITHPEACAIERKAGTLRAIRELAQGLGMSFKEPCAGARLAQETKRGNERSQAKAGDASTPHKGSSTPGPSTGGPPASHVPPSSPPQHGHEASPPIVGHPPHLPETPSLPPQQSPPVSESANTPEPSTPSTPAPIREAVAPVLEGVHESLCSLPVALCQ
jgi:hypothetical protein